MAGPMTLRNFGGIHQLVIEDADDLARIDALDPARWAATSAPLRDLHVDEAFLGFLDTDLNGRIRVAGVLAARDWLFARLGDKGGITAKSDSLLLAHLNVSTEEGEKLRHGAQHVMKELGLGEQPSLKLEQVRTFRAGYSKTLRNGDGVVPPELVTDADVAAFAKDVMATVGSVPDASGYPGANEALLSRYLEGGRAFLTWKASALTTEGVLPLGADTEAAWGQVHEFNAKVEEQFLRCEFMKQENLDESSLKRTEEELLALRAKDAAGISAYLETSPLAEPDPSCKLPIGGKVNPAFQDRWDALSKTVLAKLLPGETLLDRAGWRKVQATFAGFAAWQTARPPEPFDKIGDAQLEAQLAGPLPEKLRALIADDAAAGPELAYVATLEKLILFQRWLIELANNFVNFSSVYDPNETALVEMGSFVVDGRRLEFCLKVESAARAGHKAIASDSLAFLVYAQIFEAEGKPVAFEIVAPVTAGERGRLRLGKRGIFIDTAGKEWDAVIVEIVENAISIKEAMLSPFRRMQKFIGERIESFAQSQLASREAAAKAQSEAAVAQTANITVAGAPPAPAPAPAPAAPAPAAGGGGMQALLIGGSLAFAAIGSSLAYVVSAISNTAPLKLALSVFGVFAFIAGISAFLGWLKLRGRDLGLLFEASGWAINAEMKLTRRLGRAFTRRPAFPPGTTVDYYDVLSSEEGEEENRSRRNRRILAIFVLALIIGLVAGNIWYRRVRGG